MRMPRALQIPGFGQYCLGQGLSIIGTGMQCVLVPWYVYYQTKSAIALMLVAVTTALSLCLCPYGGVIADRYNRWNILIISQVVALAQAAVLGWIAMAGMFNLWVVLALNFLAGTITAFEFPARQAFKSELVGEDRLATVIGFYNSVDFTAFALGQAIGGVMIISLSADAATVCFFVNAASYLAALWALIAVRPRTVPKPTVATTTTEEVQSLSMMEGLRLVRSDRLVLALMLQTAIVVLFCKRFDPLLPAYAEDGLRSVEATGWLKVAMVIGAILGGLVMGRIAGKESQLRWSYRMLLALPVVLLILFAVAWEPITASLAVAIVSGVLLIQDSCCLASIQINVAPQMRGRVVSWRVTVNWGLDLLVAIPLGWAAATGGVRPVLITCAAMGAIVAIALWLSARPKAYKATA
jgi:MFS family permease